MSSNQTKKSTLADYIVIALSPALVMGLVGSLAFFLVEVFYGGDYAPELRWLLFFWVFGAVLIARISLMGEIAARAPLYGGILGVLVWIGTMRFVTYPPGSPAEPLCWLINAALVAVIFWSARQVTRDCTDVGDNEEVSADGLLQAAGLEALDPRPMEMEPEVDKPAEDVANAKPAKKRTPGVWIVYFSLAALPLFGLGQAFLPTDEEDTRERAFWLLVVYTACAPGLLLTTCFLGLRQYLRQRKMQMPAAMTGTWLAVGGGVIAALLLLAALLPRPWAETGPFRYHAGVSEERDSSDLAQLDGNAGKGEGRGDGNASRSEPDGKDAGSKSKEGSDGKDGKHGSTPNNGQSGGDKGGKAANASGGKEKGSGGQSRDGGRSNRGNRSRSGHVGDQRSAESIGSSSLAKLANAVGPVLKWIVFGLLALGVVFFLLRNGLRYLAQFSQWARDLLNSLRNFWARLFGGGTFAGRAGSEDVHAADAGVRIKPFADYPDPFADGSAQRMKATVLIRYAFEALQAWAAEREMARQAYETPAEFARRLGEEIPAIDVAARQLAALYTRAAYAAGSLPSSAVEPLRGLWQKLKAAAVAPISG